MVEGVVDAAADASSSFPFPALAFMSQVLELLAHSLRTKFSREIAQQSGQNCPQFFSSLYCRVRPIVAHTVKKLPAMQDSWVQSQGLEDPLKKGMVTHSSILAWGIPWTEEPGGSQSIELQRVGHE